MKVTWAHNVGSLTAIVEEPRQVTAGVWWIPSCLTSMLDGQDIHLYNSPFVVVGDDRVLMYDTGHATTWNATEHVLDELLGDRPIDYLVPSHPEAPHCGNVQRLLEKYPDCQLVGDVRDYHLMFPEYADRLVSMPAGSAFDLGGERFVLLEAVLKDLPSTVWGYAEKARTMFTSDAFAYAHRPPVPGEDRPPHGPGECGLLTSEIGRIPEQFEMMWIVYAAFYWARFRDIKELLPRFQQLLLDYPTTMVAPAHGSVIDDMSLLPIIWDSLSTAFDPTMTRPIAGLPETVRAQK